MKTQSESFDLLLTATQPISHHDPAARDDSNMLTFNRQKQFVERTISGGILTQEVIDEFCQCNSIPLVIADLLQPLKFSEYVACTLVCILIDLYNSLEGTGLFSGMNRYAMLETRIHSASVRASNLARFWSLVTRDLQLPIQSVANDELVIQFYRLPAPLQESVITVLTEQYRAIVTIARVWSAQAKLGNPEYAAAAGQSRLPGLDQVQVLRFNADDIAETHTHLVLEVPAVSTNSLRHQVVRGPSWVHLAQTLKLHDLRPHIPAAAEAIFENGGNIRAGVKQPREAWSLAEKIKQAFPSLELLGGVADSFDLGESKLSPSAWLVCRENAAALPGYNLPGLAVSAFDMLDDVTHTRQASEHGVGQMIYNFETLPAGAQIILRLAIKPFTSDLARGALFAALKTFAESIPSLGGQSARGYGYVIADLENLPAGADDLAQTYEAYLIDNADQLRAWLQDGTLGCGSPVATS